MIDKCQLAEMDNQGDYYTWHDKHEKDPIFSKIDRSREMLLSSRAWM